MKAAYRNLLEDGELERRAEALEALQRACRICPCECKTLRAEGERGQCGAGPQASLFSYGPHHGEEFFLSGQRGSGTLFIGHCNLHCRFCQNHDISQDHALARRGEVQPEAIADAMLHLQGLGCHNINWVSPTHSLPQIVRALAIAAQSGLVLPIVYNSNGYDALEALRLLDGVVDIYMPDLKYSDAMVAEELSGIPGYVESARAALREMHRQVGDLVANGAGIALRGMLIRLLVLPHDLSGTEESLEWIAENLGPRTVVNIMSQYRPAHRAHEDPRLTRGVSRAEYERAVDCAQRLGLSRALTQPRFL